MTLLQDFYHTTSIEQASEEQHTAHIVLNPQHNIFMGHFPDNPVTPGVCMIQIVKDLAEKITGKKLFLSSASNVKFMAIINPLENPELKLDLAISTTDQEVKLRNITYFGDTIALKMSINYKIIS